MRLGFRTLSLALFATAACTQVIGLGSYEKTDEESGGSGASGQAGSGGTVPGGAGVTFGGIAGNAPTAGETSAGAGAGAGEGGAGATGNEGGSAGSGAEGGSSAGKPPVAQGGSPSGGEGGSAGSAGEAGEGGVPTTGGTGGMAGKGGTGGTAGHGGAGGSAGSAGKGGSGGGTCTNRELLVDGAFDQESSAWTQYSDDALAVIWAPSSRTPHTAPNVAWLGGSSPIDEAEYYYSEVSQLVTVPLGTVSLTASCQVLISTDEEDEGPFDFAEVALYVEDGGQRIARFRRFSDLDYTVGWEAWTATLNAASYNIQGARVLFVLTGAEDYSNVTDFMFDTCSLVAQVCN